MFDFKTIFLKLRNIGSIRELIAENTFKILVCPLVSSRLDHVWKIHICFHAVTQNVWSTGRFVNMKCKVVRRTPRNGKQVVKIKCRQRNKPTLKLKAIERTASSGESCLFLNKKMTNLLNLIPSNYEIIPWRHKKVIYIDL